MKTLSVLVVVCSMLLCLLSVEGRLPTGTKEESCSFPSGGTEPPPLYPVSRTQCNGRSPPEGRWEAWHYLQQDLTNSTLTLQAVSNLTLKIEFGNENFTGYSGSAVGEFCCGGQVPDGVALTLDMVAVFDPYDCSFSGSMYNYQGLNFSVATKWWYDGESKMYGIFVDTIEWTIVVPGFAAHTLEFAEALPSSDDDDDGGNEEDDGDSD